jgi:ribosomal protein S18 acetylase RimI-like enzyme
MINNAYLFGVFTTTAACRIVPPHSKSITLSHKCEVMDIYELTCITGQVESAFRKLIPQLGPGIQAPEKEWLEEVLNAGNTRIFIAEDGDIRGMLTLVFQKTPSGKKAWIEDVVVDASSRGKGIGEKLVRHAVSFALEKGIYKIELTSGPERTEANQLYQKLEFEKRETNVYRLRLNQDERSLLQGRS